MAGVLCVIFPDRERQQEQQWSQRCVWCRVEFPPQWQASGGASTLLEWDGNIPSFDDCHAELLKARDYMGGDSFKRVAEVPRDISDGVSNPVSFLVPSVMETALPSERS